jgi:glycosyltransferase involved in cell wall biosynthesis
VRENVRALLAAGHEVTVVVPESIAAKDGLVGQLRRRREDGALVVRCRTRVPNLPVVATLAAGAALQATVGWLRGEGICPELVHAHVASAAVLAVPVARTLGVPLVVSEHYSGFPRGLMSRREVAMARWSLAAADLVAPVSCNLQRHMEARGVRAHFEVVPNLVDTSIFRPPPSGEPTCGPARLLLVGSLTPVKGVPYALHALKSLSRPARLEIVGEGPCRREYEQLAERFGVVDRVRFSGFQAHERVASLMQGADLLVLSSEWENLPTVVLEALACGLPAVAANVGGVSEAVGSDDGLLVTPRCGEALGAAIEQALSTPWDRPEIARRAAARFGARAVVKRWEIIYSRLLASRQGRSLEGPT